MWGFDDDAAQMVERSRPSRVALHDRLRANRKPVLYVAQDRIHQEFARLSCAVLSEQMVEIFCMSYCPDCQFEYRVGAWPFPCGGRGHRLGSFYRGPAAVHSKERAVVFRHPKTGQVVYPPRNDQPMHPVYAEQGYERVELPSLRSIENFEKTADVRSEVAWYDHGNEEKMVEQKPIDMTGLEFVAAGE